MRKDTLPLHDTGERRAVRKNAADRVSSSRRGVLGKPDKHVGHSKHLRPHAQASDARSDLIRISHVTPDDYAIIPKNHVILVRSADMRGDFTGVELRQPG